MPDIAHRGWPRDLDLIHRIRLQVRELIHARLSSGKCLTEMRNSNEHAYQVSTIASACTRLQRSARIPTCTDPLAQAFASAHNSSRPGEAAHRLAPTRINRPRQRRFAIHLLAHHNSTRLPLAQHRMCKSAACIVEAIAFPLGLPPKSLGKKKKIPSCLDGHAPVLKHLSLDLCLSCSGCNFICSSVLYACVTCLALR